MDANIPCMEHWEMRVDQKIEVSRTTWLTQVLNYLVQVTFGNSHPWPEGRFLMLDCHIINQLFFWEWNIVPWYDRQHDIRKAPFRKVRLSYPLLIRRWCTSYYNVAVKKWCVTPLGLGALGGLPGQKTVWNNPNVEIHVHIGTIDEISHSITIGYWVNPI